jgi:ketosteroid isomerase-like protein
MVGPDAEAAGTIHALGEAFVRVYNVGDLDALVETFYTEDASLLPPNQPRVWGRPQIRRFFQSLREAGMRELAAEIIQLDVSGDLAYCMGTYAFGMSAATRGQFLEVYRRQADGSWKMVVDMFSSDQAAS